MSCITNNPLHWCYERVLQESHVVFLNKNVKDLEDALINTKANVNQIGVYTNAQLTTPEVNSLRNQYFAWSYIKTFSGIIAVIASLALGVFMSPAVAGVLVSPAALGMYISQATAKIALIASAIIYLWSRRRVNHFQFQLNLYHAFELKNRVHFKAPPISDLDNDQMIIFSRIIKRCLPTYRRNVVELYIYANTRRDVLNLNAFIISGQGGNFRNLANLPKWLKENIDTVKDNNYADLFNVT